MKKEFVLVTDLNEIAELKKAGKCFYGNDNGECVLADDENFIYLKQKYYKQVEISKNKKPIVVCLCGSTRFFEAFTKANYDETLKGNIVLSVGFYPHSQKQAHGQDIGCTDEQKEMLDELHKRKIDLADEVLILNIGGYIGKSTQSEIDYAIAHNKIIRYLEENIK